MHRLLPPIVVLLFLCALSAFPENAEASGIDVFVSIPPQKHFVEKIGKERVNVHVMVPSGASPHTFSPSPGQMRKLEKAQAYFAVGVTFEKAWKDRVRAANPDMMIVDTARGIEKMPSFAGHVHELHEHGHTDHETDAHGGHDHGRHDPHIWLSPPLVMLQARNIACGLMEIDPEGEADYRANYKNFIAEIAELDMTLKKRLSPGTAFLVYHPSWGYFADAYGLRQIPVEIEGKSPKARQMKEIIGYARNEGIQSILVQPQISSRDAETIAREIGGKTVTADPLAVNWSENLLDVAGLMGEQKE